MQIVELRASDGDRILQAAELLVEGFRGLSPAWPDLEAGLKEVRESLGPDRICCAAIDAQGIVQGWIGGIRQYDGNVWELHPLVVRQDFRRRGIGRSLVKALEGRVKRQGGGSIFLGTDDEYNATSLSNVDLYTDTFEKIKNIKNLRNHPFEFYQKLGFSIVGVVPDANGPGKPDIIMAKKLAG
ncbi:MAG TPA: GNAT family N-acetyltransferase [Dehalococcoidales bacterium]|nr:GNAT family N-acetyltransferase [Dehalococcoidales bacterium]